MRYTVRQESVSQTERKLAELRKRRDRVLTLIRQLEEQQAAGDKIRATANPPLMK